MSKKKALVLPHALYFSFFLFICVWLIIEPIDTNYSYLDSFSIIFLVFLLSPIAPTVSALWVFVIELVNRKRGVASRNRALHIAAGVIGCVSTALFALFAFGVIFSLYSGIFSTVYEATISFSIIGAVAIYLLWLACLIRNKSHKRALGYKYEKK
ncbi:MAG: hypothetical protein IJY88_00415 [Clostridia bacterium]|nr:hypothetical protein [Clostridia bacterium]